VEDGFGPVDELVGEAAGGGGDHGGESAGGVS
jgi:hypothetical protein